MLPAESRATPLIPLRALDRLMTAAVPHWSDGATPSHTSSALCLPARKGLKTTLTEQSVPGSIVAPQFGEIANAAASAPRTEN